MSKATKVTVIGGGNGGFAKAGDLKIKGYHVTLFELEVYKQNVEAIMELGGINVRVLESTGLQGGFAKLDKITTDMQEALAEAEIIFVIVPSFGQEAMCRAMAPYLKAGQLVVLEPGNFGAAISFHNELKKQNADPGIYLAEAECMVYATRKDNPTTTYIRGYKRNLGIAAFPAKNNQIVFEKLKEFYPDPVLRSNVLETGLSNLNLTNHPPMVLFNLCMVDHKMDVLIYYTCLSPSVGKIIDSMDRERMALNNTGFFQLNSMADILYSYYSHQGAQGKTVQEINSTNPVFFESKLPTTTNHRYVTEDVPYGLIPFVQFAEKLGYQCPTMRAVISIANVVLGRDLYAEARTLEKLGIAEMKIDQILKYVSDGII